MDALRRRLVQIAGRGSTITYDELRGELDLSGDLVPALRSLSIAEDEAGRGLLTAVVVRQDTGLPGAGWFRLAEERGRELHDRIGMWQSERERLAGIHRELDVSSGGEES